MQRGTIITSPAIIERVYPRKQQRAVIIGRKPQKTVRAGRIFPFEIRLFQVREKGREEHFNNRAG